MIRSVRAVPRRYPGDMVAATVRHIADVNELFRHAAPPTSDDVSLTLDGRRLDSVDEVLRFIKELEAQRVSRATDTTQGD